MHNNTLVTGSLADIAQAKNISLAESFLTADAIIIIDVSASMRQTDGKKRTRYERACQELEKLQANLPGKLAVVAFASSVQFCPGGVPVFLSSATDLAKALEFIKPADGCGLKFIIISDGEPDSETAALSVAQQFESSLDTVYLGPEGGPGQDFLRRLSAASGGRAVRHGAAELNQLSSSVKLLLTT